jgi:hypothetical protein
MDALALTFPPELKRPIAIFCTLGSLASLAQVHTSYQAEAESVLYRHMAIRVKSNNVALNMLEMLKDRPQKALLVRSLTVEFPLRGSGKLDAVFAATASLCDVLSHMEALVDLRIRLPYDEIDTLKVQINQVLRERHFKLLTLHCNGYLDIVDIITEQPDLQVVGIYIDRDGDCDKLINTLERIRVVPRLHSSIPTMFALKRHPFFVPVFNTIAIYTISSTDGLYPWGAIAESIDEDVAYDISLERSDVSGVRIYLKDFSHIVFIRRLVEEMFQVFPMVGEVIFILQYPPQVLPLDHPDLFSIPASITLLREVAFICRSGRVDGSSAVWQSRVISSKKGDKPRHIRPGPSALPANLFEGIVIIMAGS